MTRIELDGGWTIAGHLNGGYLAAVCGRAASEALDGAAPLTISAHYLHAAPGGGPAEVEVDVVRRGRLSTARVSLRVDDLVLVDAIVTAGTPRDSAPLLSPAPPPGLPPWDECPDGSAGLAAEGMDLLQLLEIRLHPEVAAALSGGSPRATAVIDGWVQYRDGRPVDALLELSAWDVLMPAPWAMQMWDSLPTVAAQVVLYPGPVVGPLALEARCEILRDGVGDETSRVWDSTGRLVSSARQTAILTSRPPA